MPQPSPSNSSSGSGARSTWAWLQVGLWALVVWVLGGEALSLGSTSRFFGPLIRWLLPDISPAASAQLLFAVRKAAHVTEYAALAFLILRALLLGKSMGRSMGRSLGKSLRRSFGKSLWPRATLSRSALAALGLAAAFAAADETRQGFSISRTGSLWDVALDAAGAATGVGLLLFARLQLPRLGQRIGLLDPAETSGATGAASTNSEDSQTGTVA